MDKLHQLNLRPEVVKGLGLTTMIGSPNNGRPPNENFCLGMELKDLIIKPDRDCIEDRGTVKITKPSAVFLPDKAISGTIFGTISGGLQVVSIAVPLTRSGWFHGEQCFWSQIWEMLKVSMLFQRIIKDSRGPPRRQLITKILLASQLLACLGLGRHDNINPETLRRENCKTGGSFVSEYADHDIAGTLAAEEAGQVAKLRSVLESVDHKRRKILQQMRGDAHLLNLEEGSPPIQPRFFSPIHHKMWRKGVPRYIPNVFL
ncbi:hypothetical protein F2Q69_00050334 [Brassica cretica]|uniref:Uncharacterized protein n=1 Tax=Brassica cretica TaxID=69181 RepID=A0A8S9PM57_BRACR|nr:hypothetical protein F2Q69_00050334 [Brassica cretica]